MKKGVEGSTKGWWCVRFRIKWLENTKPLWHIDLILADKIISPVLCQYRNSLHLWRFHRRAPMWKAQGIRDPVGHQFSFWFYSSPGTAKRVYNPIKSNTLLRKMKDIGLILKDTYDDPSKITAPDIEDASGGKGSLPIKKSWPYFAMGISQMWLALIAEIAEDTSTERKASSLAETLAFYQQVNETIKKLWQEEGCYAFIHHLNSIFGYEPVVVYGTHLMKF